MGIPPVEIFRGGCVFAEQHDCRRALCHPAAGMAIVVVRAALTVGFAVAQVTLLPRESGYAGRSI